MLKLAKSARRRFPVVSLFIGPVFFAALVVALHSVFEGPDVEIPIWQRATAVAALLFLTQDSADAAALERARRGDFSGRVLDAMTLAWFWVPATYILFPTGSALADLGFWLACGVAFGLLVCLLPSKQDAEHMDLLRADFPDAALAPSSSVLFLAGLAPLFGVGLAVWTLTTGGDHMDAVLPLVLMSGIAPVHKPVGRRTVPRLAGAVLLIIAVLGPI